MSEALRTIGIGLHYEDLSVGLRFKTAARTITETDLVNFVNLTWLTEELFTNVEREGAAISGRVVPGALVYAFAEGLYAPAMNFTGLAFLNAELDVKGPTFVGDTIHVEIEVTELRLTSKGDRGLARTVNQVVKQDGKVVLTYNPLRMVKRQA
jgi:acyl dehydratase